mmetsp:Transcript_8252/g.20273  ORF Transcript_8252/g.20273 Transcript_8252/m.20273 type:complete len:1855 (+) Transcript_8252:338-5902(+)
MGKKKDPAIRHQVAREILSTEETYVAQLDTLLQIYLQPLSKSLTDKKPILKQKYIKMLFRNVMHIRGIHGTFLADIKKAGDEVENKFGEIFARFAHFFKMYTDYVNEHESASNALAYLNKASKYLQFQTFCKTASAHPMSKGLNLASLLITPIQRIPRYKLLLNELYKNTEDEHKDKSNLEKAIKIVSATAKHINDAVRGFQNRKEIQQVMDELMGNENLLEPHRRFIRKGELIRQTRNKPRMFMFYLFNDILIYASPRGWKYRLHLKAAIDSHFKIEVYGTADGKDADCGPELKKTGSAIVEKNKGQYPSMYLWQIVTQQKSFVVFSTTIERGRSWVKDIKRCQNLAMKTIQGRKKDKIEVGTAPVWQPDSEARACTVCAKPFGFIRRRHHCRQCGLLVCGDCSKGRMCLDWCPNNGKQRVCNKCFVKLGGSQLENMSMHRGSTLMLKAPSFSHITIKVANEKESEKEKGDSVSATDDGANQPSERSTLPRIQESGATIGDSMTTFGNSKFDRDGDLILPPPPRRISKAPTDTTDDTAPEAPTTAMGLGLDSVKDSKSLSSSMNISSSMTEEDRGLGGTLSPPVTSPKLSRFSILRFSELDEEKRRSSASSMDSKRIETWLPGDADVVLSEWVWLPHSQQAFVAARLEEEQEDGQSRYRTVDGEVICMKTKDVKGKLRSAGQQVRDGDVEDLTMLSNKDFSEGSLLHIIRHRYKHDEIYTTMGGILVAVNPFRMLPLYTMDILNSYKNAEAYNLSTTLPPHVFAVAAEAFNGLKVDRLNQSVIIAGESGAGKTETTKLILQYLSEVADSDTGVEEELLQSNPLLEAFGNAKTLRNDNSSRFGKWMAISFSMPTAKICAGEIQHYLLEKTRVVSTQPGERNYHIFHQLCAFANGSRTDLKGEGREWGSEIRRLVESMDVQQAPAYHYTNQGTTEKLKAYDDEEEFLHTIAAMEHCGISLENTRNILQLLVAILHLGNIKFSPKEINNPRSPSRIQPENEVDVRKVAGLLGVEAKSLEFALVNRTIDSSSSAGGEGEGGGLVEIPLNVSESEDARDALAKAMYSGTFDWLVGSINKALRKNTGTQDGDSCELQIGVLDIFGFEVFETNSLEQLFINYANEKLQQFFNQFVFKSEQKLYGEEGLSVEHVTFNDNQECLNLIEGFAKKKVLKKKVFGAKNPASLLKILDECVVMPNPTDAKLLQRMIDTHNLITSTTSRNPNVNKHFAVPRGSKKKSQFIVKHYSGDVAYSIKGFLEKNRDHVHLSLKDLLRNSSSSILNQLFPPEDDDDGLPSVKTPASKKPSVLDRFETRSRKMTLVEKAKQKEKEFKRMTLRKSTKKHKKAIRTLGSQFKGSIKSLVNSLRETSPHFIRCIKPNAEKKAFCFDAPTVLRQMRTGGLIEALGIRRLGFPYRKDHAQFVERYGAISQLPKRNRSDGDATSSAEVSGDGKVEKRCRELVEDILCVGEERYESLREAKSIQMGKTMVFWTGAARRLIENWRQEGYITSSTTLQALARSVLAKQSAQALKEVAEDDKKQETHVRESAPKIPSEPSPMDAVESLLAIPVIPAEEGKQESTRLAGNEKTLYESAIKTKGQFTLAMVKKLNKDYLKGLFLNWKSAKKSKFIFQKSGIPSALLELKVSAIQDKALAKSEAKGLKKKALLTFDNMLRYMKVKYHPFPDTTGFAVVSAGHAEPVLRDEIFCQLIKQTTASPKLEYQVRGFKLMYLCLSAFMPIDEDVSRALISNIAIFAAPEWEAKLPNVASSVEEVATHCLTLFISNRQMQELENQCEASDHLHPPVGKIKDSRSRSASGFGERDENRFDSEGGELYVTLDLVRRVTRGELVEQEPPSESDVVD